MPIQSENRDQGPKGSIETKTSSTSMPKAMEEASKASGQIPWLHSAVPKPSRPSHDRSRLQAFRSGLAPLRDTGARKRPYVYRCVYKCRLQRGYIWYRFVFRHKFILVLTQIHLVFHSNSFVFFHKWIWVTPKMGQRCLNRGIPTKRPRSAWRKLLQDQPGP